MHPRRCLVRSLKETVICTRRIVGNASVALAMATTNNGMVEVGNVTIPVNFSVPPVAALVAIRYLYAYPGGSLYQPVYLGERTDVDVDEYATLKFKQGSEEDEV